MSPDLNPVYRKVIIPWYDSEAACFCVIAAMFFVFLFGFAGITVARETVEYHAYIWIPVIVVVTSGWIVISTTIRLTKRYMDRLST